MKNDKALREHLSRLLKGGDAHADFEAAVKDMPASAQGRKPQGAEHSPWEELEHIRIAQWDILEFCRNPKHVSPEFPSGYWPTTAIPPDAKAWDKSVATVRKETRDFIELVSSESTDLFAKIPHGDGQTVLREALVAADHTSYHLGQLVLLRRLLGAWK